jgi:hypothetical protein
VAKDGGTWLQSQLLEKPMQEYHVLETSLSNTAKTLSKTVEQNIFNSCSAVKNTELYAQNVKKGLYNYFVL